MKAGIFKVSQELLEKLLFLPEGDRITDCRWDMYGNCMELKVEGSDESGLPEVAHGEAIQKVSLWLKEVDGVTQFDRWYL